MSSRTKVVLGDAEVADIVNGRQLKGAVPLFAKKYGVSSTRIRNIYKKYYGGTTLADAATGLKAPLPGTLAPASPASTKETPKKPRGRAAGKFVVDDAPTSVPARGAALRAKPVRAVKPEVAGSGAPSLEVAQGVQQAGNNSGDLAHAIEQLLKARGGASQRQEASDARSVGEPSILSEGIYSDTSESSDSEDATESSVYEASAREEEEQLPGPRGRKAPERGGLLGQPSRTREVGSERHMGRSEVSSEGVGSWDYQDHRRVDGELLDEAFRSGSEGYTQERAGAESEGGIQGAGTRLGARGPEGGRRGPAGGDEREGRGRETGGREGAARPVRSSYWPIPTAGGGVYCGSEEEVSGDVQPLSPVRPAARAEDSRGAPRAGGSYGSPGGPENTRGHRVPDSRDREPRQSGWPADRPVFVPGFAGAQRTQELSYLEKLRRAKRPA